mmetsp:Transcript_59253/g.94017  ORF Transcript_59253/g.94017 Transcript_59253/m.94017 type:complete len:194 (+) Transcript_59253:63-644(+)
MGAEQSVAPASTPYPESWLQQGNAPSISGICDISKMKPLEFIAVQPPIPELEPTAWKFEPFLAYAATAIKRDIALTRLVDGMVPKRLSEDEFWRLYFCHVYIIVTGAVNYQAKSEDCNASSVEQYDATTSAPIVMATSMTDAFSPDRTSKQAEESSPFTSADVKLPERSAVPSTYSLEANQAVGSTEAASPFS